MSAKAIVSFLVVLSVQYIACDSLPCDFIDSVNITDGHRMPNGDIVHDGVVYKPKYYRYIDYEYVNFSKKNMVAPYIRGCLCAVRICVRLCCKDNDVFNYGCVATNETQPVLVNTTLFNPNGTAELFDLRTNPMYGFLHGKPCQQVYQLLPQKLDVDNWSLVRNGSMVDGVGMLMTRNQYCLVPVNESEQISAFVCFMPHEDIKYTVYPIGMLLSVPFLLVTFLVYAIIPELRNMHGKSLMSYVLGLFVGYTALSLVQMRFYFGSTVPCIVAGYIIYFAFMVSFFWLNVMSFDVYWTFRGVTGVRSSDRKKFVLYSLYAWGCPILLVTIALVADYTDLIPTHFRPRIGITRCLIIEDKLIEFLYMYLPLLILVIANVIFFVITALRIFKVQRETSVVRRGDSKRHSKLDNDRDRYSLYLRLFIMMGVTWSLEIISWVVDNNAWIFYVSDTCNCIQGFLIFVLFVWKQKVKRLIYKKFGIQQSRQDQTMSTCSTRTTSTTISSYNGSKMEKPLVSRTSTNFSYQPSRL